MTRSRVAIVLSSAAIALSSFACSSDSGDGDGTGATSAGGQAQNGAGAPSAGGVGGASGGTSGGAAGGTSGGLAGASNPSGVEPVGSFTVRLEALRSITTISGSVRDAPAIEAVPYVGDMKSGVCQLFLPKIPFCEEQCASDRVCVPTETSSGTCQLRPKSYSVGTVTVNGVATEDGANQFAMEPIGASKSYGAPSGVKLKYPPAAPGSELRITTSGGDFEPFEIVTKAIGPIEGFSSEPIPLNRNQPLELTWTAAAGAEIEAVLEIAHHGGAKGKVICLTEDTGKLTIPADLVTSLMDLGVAGFPDVTVTRKSVGKAANAPRLEFIMFADANRPVAIEGLTSCNTDEDCPTDQVCGQDKACAAP